MFIRRRAVFGPVQFRFQLQDVREMFFERG